MHQPIGKQQMDQMHRLVYTL